MTITILNIVVDIFDAKHKINLETLFITSIMIIKLTIFDIPVL